MRQKFSKEQDNELIRLYSSGVLVKLIAERLGRTTGTVYDRLHSLQEAGILNRRAKMDYTTVHLRVPRNISSALRTQAKLKGKTLNAHLNTILKNWVG